MTKEKQLIRSIVGPTRGEMRTFACAVKEAERVLFWEKISMDDILITKDIYPVAARITQKSQYAVSRQVERLGNRCFDCMSDTEKKQYIGRAIKELRAPSEMVFYLAFYCHFGKTYYDVIIENPEILF